VPGAVRETSGYVGGGGTAGLLLAGATHSYTATQRVKTKHFEWRAVTACNMRMPSSQDEKLQLTIYNETLRMGVYRIPIFSGSVCGQYKRAKARACSYITKGMRHYEIIKLHSECKRVPISGNNSRVSVSAHMREQMNRRLQSANYLLPVFYMHTFVQSASLKI
jgi:hypothetical protein